MTSYPSISVIIPTFRRPILLKRAIDSVLAQTYPHFHIWIYDNASQDATNQIVAQYRDERIHYYLHAKNIGLNKNYNFSLDRVNAPFFVFLSDDDVFMPAFLEEAMNGFERYPQAGIFIGGMIYMDVKKRLMGAIVHEWMTKPHYSSQEIVREVIEGRFSALINTMVFRRDVREAIGSFNETIWFDVDFIVKALVQFSVILSSISCMIYQLHSNVSHGANICEYWNMHMALRDTILNFHQIAPQERNDVELAMSKERRRFIFKMAYQRFVTLRFEESLQGIDLLQAHYSLNRQEKMMRRLSKIFIRFSFLTYFLRVVIHVWRALMRFSHFRRLKRKIGDANYRAFTKMTSRM